MIKEGKEMKKFIFRFMAFLIVLMIGGAYWNRDARKDSQISKYQERIASQEQKIQGLEESLLRMQDTLDVYEITWDVLRGADSTAIEGLLKYIWNVYDADFCEDLEPIETKIILS